jgi:hypothetical protein
MRSLPFILSALFFFSCESSHHITALHFPLDEEFRLQPGESMSIGDGAMLIKFKMLAEDSRCPEGAVCVWQGNARVILEVDRSELALNTFLEPKQSTMNGYTIRLVDVDPYPKIGSSIPPGNYSIRIIVTKKR